MPQYYVYQTEQGGVFKTIDTSGSQSARAADVLIAQKEGAPVGAVNWYGASADTPEKAIEKAKINGYSYRSTEEMLALYSRLSEFTND